MIVRLGQNFEKKFGYLCPFQYHLFIQGVAFQTVSEKITICIFIFIVSTKSVHYR